MKKRKKFVEKHKYQNKQIVFDARVNSTCLHMDSNWLMHYNRSCTCNVKIEVENVMNFMLRIYDNYNSNMNILSSHKLCICFNIEQNISFSRTSLYFSIAILLNKIQKDYYFYICIVFYLYTNMHTGCADIFCFSR